jgi:hypothetical protein
MPHFAASITAAALRVDEAVAPLEVAEVPAPEGEEPLPLPDPPVADGLLLLWLVVELFVADPVVPVELVLARSRPPWTFSG